MRRSSTLASVEQYVSAVRETQGEMWLFAYGSLMWHTPAGVTVLRREQATLHGYERSFCVYSRNYRGSPDAPGLVLGLQPSDTGHCEGVAACLGYANDATAQASLENIDAQEMITRSNPLPVYLRRLEPVVLGSTPDRATTVLALAYTTNSAPGATAPPDLPLSRRAAIIAQASGGRGPNREYLEQTAAQLKALAIVDEHVERLLAHIESHAPK